MPYEDTSALNIGLTCDWLISWQGGRVFFHQIVACLTAAAGPGDRFAVLVSEEEPLPTRLRRLGRAIIGGGPARVSDVIGSANRRSARQAIGPRARELKVRSFQQARDYDVVGPLGSPPRDCAAWVGYIPDVQHRWLPEMFSAEERQARDQRFASVVRRAGALITNAGAVRRDLVEFYDADPRKIFVMPFSACPEPEWLVDRPDVRERYQLHGEYFICCNQFWKHKNHKVIFEALAIAKQRGDDMRCVFTGPTEDYRNPEYFRSLCEFVETCGISDQVAILGLVDRDDQIQLLRSAIALVQPTLFEGGPGGGAGFDAIALGCRTIFSELPVNREIDSLATAYFEPNSPGALYEQMARLARTPRPNPAAADLLAAGAERRLACGRVLREAFAHATIGGLQEASVASRGLRRS